MTLIICLLILLINVADGNDCLKSCDLNHSEGDAYTFCGIDEITYTTTYEAISDGSCYINCGITALYEGVCGCPNECNVQFEQGSCIDSKCVCNQGWGGNDCSLPVGGNVCGYHGKLIPVSSKDNSFPFDYCNCEDGWTGTDCTTPKLTIGNAPWGTIYENTAPAYSSTDEYGDDSPLFNIERLPTIRLELDWNDFIYLVTPANLWNASYVSANFFWDNGKTRHQLLKIGMKLKGQGSRGGQQKGFTLKFNEFVEGQELYEMKKIGLKPGYGGPTAVFMKNLLYSNFMRATGNPTSRESFALLYINSVYYGVMIVAEDIDDLFISRRFEDDPGSGSFFKFYWNVNLNYLGSDPTYYQSLIYQTDIAGGKIPYYMPEVDVPEVWSDLISVLTYFNTTQGKDFEENAQQALDIQSLLRAMVVESFVVADDQFKNGNNYYLYHRMDHETPLSWAVFYYDFDSCLRFTPPDSNNPDEDGDIFTFFQKNIANYKEYNPILDQIFQSNSLTSQYVQDYEIFLNQIFGSNSKQQPVYRFNEMFNFLASWVAKDKFWQLSNGMTQEKFVLDAEQTIQHLQWRYQDVYKQIGNYKMHLSSLRKT
jgi:hypothetical protein